MTRKEFERLVEFALRSIPKRFRDNMKNIAVVVEDAPAPELLAEMEIEEGDSLYGLFQGTPLTERGWSDGTRMPDRISIYQRPIEEVVETVIHEFGHYFGLSEEEIEAIEDEFWNSEDDDDEEEQEENAAGEREQGGDKQGGRKQGGGGKGRR
jgi:predicted Zn-dependent protease with MMP-like domain